VHFICIDKLGLVIPYDIEFEIIKKAYQDFSYSDNVENPYEEQVDFIESNISLLSELKQANEA